MVHVPSNSPWLKNEPQLHYKMLRWQLTINTTNLRGKAATRAQEANIETPMLRAYKSGTQNFKKEKDLYKKLS